MRGGGPKKAPKNGKQRQARAEEDKAFGLKYKNPRSLPVEKRDDNDQTMTDRILALVRPTAKMLGKRQASEQALKTCTENFCNMTRFFSNQNISQKTLTFVSIKRPGILYQDPEPFQRKWIKLAGEKDVAVLCDKAEADFMLVVHDLRDETACTEFARVIASYKKACDKPLKREHAACFIEIANGRKLRALITETIPQNKWPLLLGSSGLCSAVVKGKGEALISFLNDTRISRDKWPSILSKDSLCSAVVKGKGAALTSFLNDSRIPHDKWPSLLSSGSLCSAVVKGKGEALMSFLNDTRIPHDKWPLLLGKNSLCSAVVKGKGEALISFLKNENVSHGKWHNVMSVNSLVSSIAKGRPVDLYRFKSE